MDYFIKRFALVFAISEKDETEESVGGLEVAE